MEIIKFTLFETNNQYFIQELSELQQINIKYLLVFLFEVCFILFIFSLQLEQISAWGMRVDKLVTSTAWQEMKAVSAQLGLVASGYEREFDEWRFVGYMTSC